MSENEVLCRKGDTCRFVVKVGTPDNGLDPRYDQARFEARETWDTSKPALLSVDETTGISFDYELSTVTVEIGASLTQPLQVSRSRYVAAQLRLYNSSNEDDVVSWAITFKLEPAAVKE